MLRKTAKGRPKFKVKPGQRVTVELLVAVGEGHYFIARAIGCSAVTLRAHFASELANGAARRRAEIILLIYRSALRGNISAMRKLEQMMHLAALKATAPKPKPLGKKAQAHLEAHKVIEGPWGDLLNPPAPPRGVH